jgi:lysophospholipase L1-like esterase
MHIGLGIRMSGNRGAGGGIAPIYRDDFVGTTGTALTSHTADSGQSWMQVSTVSTGTMQLTSDGGVKNTGGVIGLYYLDTPIINDGWVAAQVNMTATLGTSSSGIAFRVNASSDTCYAIVVTPSSSNRFLLTKRIAGASTTLGSFLGNAFPDPTSDLYLRAPDQREIRLECEGTNIRAFLDGRLVISVTDASIASGRPGIYQVFYATDTTGNHIRGWSAGTLPALAPGGLGTSLYKGGVAAVRSNGATIYADEPDVASTIQWHRSTSSPTFTPSGATEISGATSSPLNDTGAAANTTHYYRIVATRGAQSVASPSYFVTTPPTTRRRLICVGNSLTWGTGVTVGTQDYPSLLRASLGAGWDVINIGVPSASDANILSTLTRRMSHWIDTALTQCVVVYWEGTNSCLAKTGANSWADTALSLQGLATAGAPTILVANVIDRQQSGIPADFATRRSDYNTALLANFATYADGMIDLASVANLSDSTNTTYFNADKVHLTAAGYQEVATAVDTALAPYK